MSRFGGGWQVWKCADFPSLSSIVTLLRNWTSILGMFWYFWHFGQSSTLVWTVEVNWWCFLSTCPQIVVGWGLMCTFFMSLSSINRLVTYFSQLSCFFSALCCRVGVSAQCFIAFSQNCWLSMYESLWWGLAGLEMCWFPVTVKYSHTFKEFEHPF